MKKKLLKIKNNEPRETKCDGQNSNDYFVDPGPDSLPIEKDYDEIIMRGFYLKTNMLPENICYIKVWTSDGYLDHTAYEFTATFADRKTLVIDFAWPNKEPNSLITGYIIHVHYVAKDGLHYIHEKLIEEFVNYDFTVEAWLKADFEKEITTTSVKFDIETESGRDLNKYMNSWTDVISAVSDSSNKPIGQTNRVPKQNLDTLSMEITGLEPGTYYDNLKITGDVEIYSSREIQTLTADILPFTTKFIIVEPSFSTFNNVRGNDIFIDYILDMGTTSDGEEWILNSKISLYDKDDVLLDTKTKTEDSFLVKNLSNGTYKGWYLSAKTSYSSEAIIGEIDTFVIDAGDIVEPYFSDYAVVTSDTSVEVSYQFNLGKDPNGDPYDLIGLIVLYNDKKQPIDSSDKIGDTLKANNLTPDTTYSDWSLETYTTYSTEAVNQPLDDFTTTSRKTTIKNN